MKICALQFKRTKNICAVLLLLPLLFSLSGAAETEIADAVPDYSAGANPAVFTETLTREMYNTIRHMLVTGEQSPLAAMDTETELVYQRVLSRLGKWPSFGYAADLTDGETRKGFFPFYPENYEEAAAYCTAFLGTLPPGDTVENIITRFRAIAKFVCDRMTYQGWQYVGPHKVLVSDAVTPGNCMSYAINYQFVCQLAGIPCIMNGSAIHEWTEIYFDGQWWVADMMFMDEGDEPIPDNRLTLWEQDRKQGETFEEEWPEIILFVKELTVPGSTAE